MADTQSARFDGQAQNASATQEPFASEQYPEHQEYAPRGDEQFQSQQHLHGMPSFDASQFSNEQDATPTSAAPAFERGLASTSPVTSGAAPASYFSSFTGDGGFPAHPPFDSQVHMASQATSMMDNRQQFDTTLDAYQPAQATGRRQRVECEDGEEAPSRKKTRKSDAAKGNRLAKACDGCSRRKIKCDDARPCKGCTDLNIPCTSTREAKRRGPENKVARAIKEAGLIQAPITHVDAPAHSVKPVNGFSLQNYGREMDPILSQVALEAAHHFFNEVHSIYPFLNESFLAGDLASKIENESIKGLIAVIVYVGVAASRSHFTKRSQELELGEIVDLEKYCEDIALQRFARALYTAPTLHDIYAMFYIGLARQYTHMHAEASRLFVVSLVALGQMKSAEALIHPDLLATNDTTGLALAILERFNIAQLEGIQLDQITKSIATAGDHSFAPGDLVTAAIALNSDNSGTEAWLSAMQTCSEAEKQLGAEYGKDLRHDIHQVQKRLDILLVYIEAIKKMRLKWEGGQDEMDRLQQHFIQLFKVMNRENSAAFSFAKVFKLDAIITKLHDEHLTNPLPIPQPFIDELSYFGPAAAKFAEDTESFLSIDHFWAEFERIGPRLVVIS
ncbi:hypothetical protein K402DRAFT_454843 [Aulographum hederae CBS 113979]|uniref:Zn(2)-C6 fungal-type domain-containing protein n=1 Tax=Aulographum hederae CBS 113979 TaxID=1176131 RepID=A0A6G1GYL4_9PEZI|nr:hypothetical protein K402DRAFT_454843 [Aulographum hederae CBS 113979]